MAEEIKENNSLRKHENWIDVLKCIAIVCVVVYHNMMFPSAFLGSKDLMQYVAWFLKGSLSVCVPLFFFVNGYLVLGYQFGLEKHIKKTVRFILLTVVWGAITLACLMPIKNQFFTIKEFLIALASWKHGWLHHMWYMGALVCIYIFVPLIKNVYDHNKYIFIYFLVVCFMFTFGNTLLSEVATIGLYIFKNIDYQVSENFFSMFNPFRKIYGYSFVYFCLGGVVNYYKVQISNLTKRKRYIVGIGCIGAGVVCLGIYGMFVSTIAGAYWDIVWGGYDTVFTLSIVIGLYILSLNFNRDNKLIKLVSSNTLGIYFLHWILGPLFKPYIYETGLFNNIPMNFVYAAFIIFVSVIICCVIRKIPYVKYLL